MISLKIKLMKKIINAKLVMIKIGNNAIPYCGNFSI